jgi:hypothetical protein
VLGGQLDRVLAVPGLPDDLVALFLQHLGQVHPDQRLVLGDHDPLALRAALLGCHGRLHLSPVSGSGRP